MKHLNRTIDATILALLIGVAIALFACKHGDDETGYSTGKYDGIDVSNHQGRIRWKEVAQNKNIKFVYIKATEGASYRDKYYDTNVKEARAAGLKIGSYHYLRNSTSVEAQFNNFTSAAKRDEQDLIPMVDVEESVSKDKIKDFLNRLEKHYGKRPAIYGTMRSYNSYCAPTFNDYTLMIGRYGKNAPVITGRGHYSIWQYSEKGRIKGIPKPVDLDRLHPDFPLKNLFLNN